MRVLIFLAALLCGLPSFAADRCDVDVPVQLADLKEVRIAYQSIGSESDPALLLVMGLGGQLIHWPDEVVVALCEQGYRVIRYDNRDFGLSTWVQQPADANLTVEVLRYKLGLPVSSPYSLTDMADDALGLMDALQIRQFHVLGASMGGMIAQHLAEPSRVELLNRLRLPVLVVHGTADPLLPVMHGVHVAAHIQGSQLRLIPGLAHRFQEAFKAPLLGAVLPYLKARHEDGRNLAQL
ncbi:MULTISPECIES: alpha/beta fold hydrolase [Pseudomonas syringae group]|uniref:Alpha/beta hydrolase n=2 Tax=Pseudomonas syringae group TaxID=136849 RepID=A0ABY1UB37_PSESX|nr:MULTISPECIES: alpha/beta hydrolase [Pseudomonas syringae group]POQ01189.1 hypothetical protein CXB40_24515 [Pseudomonas syringae pv. avii]SOQ12802.1 Alpha/beta hydrolase fold protein [Pseudomonas syringae pv. persicae]SOQ12819.1 Alpha/beta hydrolase fold protein [Pseudomonas syringae pv. persicae]SOS28581.1 alpha/beta hydrolase [Pseudomonas syringae pv. avii]